MSLRFLGRSPHPFNGEHLNAYLCRLSTVNGLGNIRELLFAIGLKKPKLDDYGGWKGENDQLVSLLTQVLRREFDLSLFQYYHSDFYNRFGRSFKNLLVGFPRFCPFCIKDKYIDWRWQLCHIHHCDKHNCLLIDNCPKCEKPLRWTSEIFTHCRLCNFKWEEISVDKILPTNLAIDAYPEIQGNIEPPSFELEAITQAIIQIARPFDKIHPNFHHAHYTKNFSKLVEKAYRLLSDTAFYDAWQKAYKESLRDENYESIKFTEVKEYVSPSRLKLLNKNDSLKSLRQHVDFKLLAKELKLPEAEILKLIEKRTLPQLNTTNVVPDKLFNILKVKTFLTEKLTSNVIKDTTIVHFGDKVFEEYLTNYAELINSICLGEIKGNIADKVSFSSIKVESKQFRCWLKKQLDYVCEQPVEIEKVASFLGKTSEELKKLIPNSELFYTKWRKCDSIDGQSLKAYLKLIKPELFI